MFDELHDQTPPAGDSHQFAAVAERAAAIRRRRNAVIGSVGALVVFVGGAVAISALSGDESRIATLDAAADLSTSVPVVAPPSTLPAASSIPASTAPATTIAATAETTVTTATTTVASPVSPTIGEAVPLECGGFRVCSYDHLADGRLVQLANDGSESGPPTFTIFDDTANAVEATGSLGNFDAVSASLVDVGPDDIAYVWYIRRDSEPARIGAFEMSGPDAGRQIVEFDFDVDPSGDTEQVPTRNGFVEVGCCGTDTVRPAAGAEVVVPWVDRTGTPIVNDDDTYFSIDVTDQTLTITAIRGEAEQSWSFPDQESAPRGMPLLYQLDDGRVLYDFEPMHSGGQSSLPTYLNPDGSIDVGLSPGSVLHALPDGRVVVRNLEKQTYSLVTLSQTTSGNPEGEPVVPAVNFFDGLEPCSTPRSCSYDHLDDGSLVQLDTNDRLDLSPAQQPDNQAFVRIYGDAGNVIVELDGDFEAWATFLLDVGPGNTAYTWIPGVGDNGQVVAHALTGSQAGTQVGSWELPSPDQGMRSLPAPSQSGFALCCPGTGLIPRADAPIVVPWITADGLTVVDVRPHFLVDRGDDLTVVLEGFGGDPLSEDLETRTTWTGIETNVQSDLPRLFRLDDGGAVLIDDGTTDGNTPVFLLPDGTHVRGEGLGFIRHVLPDGRLVREPDTDQGVIPDVADSTVARPLVAIDVDGDAVHFDDADSNSTLIFDGPPADGSTTGDGPNGVDRVAYSAVHDTYSVGLCCSPIVGTVLSGTADELPVAEYVPDPEPSHVGLDGYGYAPTFNSQGGRLAAIGPDSDIVVSDTAPGFSGSIELPDRAGDASDVVWIDHDRVGVLGRFDNVWTLTVVRYTVSVGDGGASDDPLDWLGIESSRPFGLVANFDDLRFAGTAVDSEVAMHDIGTDQVLSGTIDDYGNNNGDERGSALQVITLPGPAQSAWYVDPVQLIWVDADNVLRVGDRIIPGDYTWARR